MIDSEIFKDLSELKCITPLAFAGHGKGYMVDLIGENLNKECTSLSFSNPVKSIIADSFSQDKINQLLKETPEIEINPNNKEEVFEYFEYLKNDKHNIKVFGELNMREFMILVMGDEFLLHADPEIKVKLICLDAIEKIKQNENLVFIADSTRYEEEVLFSFLLNKSENTTDFFNNYIYSNRKSDGIQLLQDRVMDIRLSLEKMLSQEDSNTLNNIFFKVAEKMQSMLSLKGEKIDFQDKARKERLAYFNSDQYTKMTDYGVLHIFRTLLPRDYSGKDDLEKSILKYTGISESELKSIKQNYMDYEIDFNPDNIHDFGFLRANPNHLSEKGLSLYKGIALINKPNMSISDLINQMKTIKDKTIHLTKNKPIYNEKPKP